MSNNLAGAFWFSLLTGWITLHLFCLFCNRGRASVIFVHRWRRVPFGLWRRNCGIPGDELWSWRRLFQILVCEGWQRCVLARLKGFGACGFADCRGSLELVDPLQLLPLLLSELVQYDLLIETFSYMAKQGRSRTLDACLISCLVPVCWASPRLRLTHNLTKNFDFCFPPGLRHLLQLLTLGLAPKSEKLMQSQTTETDSKILTHHRLALVRFELAPALPDPFHLVGLIA